MVITFTALSVFAQDGVYLVNAQLKAWPWKQYNMSYGKPEGIYVERKGKKIFTTVLCKYGTFAEAKTAVASFTDARLPMPVDVQMLHREADYNDAFAKAYKLRGENMLDYEDPVEGQHGIWVEDGRICFYDHFSTNDYAYALFVYKNDYLSQIVKQVDSSKLSGQESQSASSTKMTAQDGIYIVNGYLKAWPWEQYDESNGKPVGIYVEQNGSAVFTDIHCSYRGSTDMINLESSVREIGQHLPETRNDIRLLYNNCDEFNEAFGKAYKLSGQNMANYVDPIGGQRCLWLSDGHVSFFDRTELPDRDSQTYFMALFDDKYVAKVAKQAMPSHPLKLTRTGKSSQTQKSVQSQKPTVQRGGQAGTLKATATVRTIDKSGAHYQNRGYTYTNLIEDVTVTLSNINAYFRNTPSGMPEGGCPIIRVFLVRFLPNGNPETVGTYDIDVLPDPVKDEWKSPQTQTVRFKTPWNKLWNRYGQGTVKYQYQIVIPRKAGPELIYKTPVRQITITNIPQPRR